MSEYIDREQALLEIEEWADTFCECDYVWPHVIGSITKLPAADVQPVRRGRWLRTPTYWAYCSVCGEEPPDETNITTNFCPNCGADMREES